MGSKIQIRVVAQTFRPEDILEDWPKLAQLAWRGELTLPGGEKRGVLELTQDLWDKIRFDVEPEVRRALELGLNRAVALVRSLEAALGDWKATEAARLALELESLLDELEPLAPQAPFVVSKPKAKR